MSDDQEIVYVDRQSGKVLKESVPAGKMMHWLYGSPMGRAALHLLLKRKLVSSLGGWFLNTKRSKKRIQPFIYDYKINMSHYLVSEASSFKHFNDFFYRKIDPAKRPIGEGVVSPADGKTLAFQHITDQTKFFVKGSSFTLNRFLRNGNLAKKYEGGSMIIVRLAPTDYHRYHFPAEGKAGVSKLIKGKYFSVSPIALRQSLEIFCQNKRTICTLATKEAGDVLISEVGATMVGSILQTYKPNTKVEKGSEKGYFAFGGSTVVLLFEKGKVLLSDDLLENTAKGLETQVKMGETIANPV